MKYNNLSDTKKLIFKASIDLIATRSFENVTILDISKAIGRTKSGIYNHFSSKQEILDDIYEFFREHFRYNRKTLEQIKPIIASGSILDIIHALIYEYGNVEDLMIPILRIINQRKYFDEQARSIVHDLLIEDSIQYAKNVFDYAVSVGRFAPFDTHTFAIFCNNCRLSFYDKWILNPTEENRQYLAKEQDRIYLYATRLIVDLKP